MYLKGKSIHIFVTIEFGGRIIGDDLEIIPDRHAHVLTAYMTERITLKVYKDDPMYLSIISVDQTPILKETLIQNVQKYVFSAQRDLNFHDFLIEFAPANPNPATTWKAFANLFLKGFLFQTRAR